VGQTLGLQPAPGRLWEGRPGLPAHVLKFHELTSNISMIHINAAKKYILLTAALALPAAAQVWDNTGNGKLNGNYYFREVIYTSNDAFALYGNINFSGTGTFTINAMGLQYSTGAAAGAFTSSGTYTVAASGYGSISNQVLNSPIYGLVGANGVFVGSATENGNYDLFIAAPINGQAIGTLQGSYSLAYMNALSPYDAFVQVSPNGAGALGNVNLSAYAASTNPTNQSITGVKYFVSNNAFVVTFPNSSTNALAGQQYWYATPDGSFIFGGAPQGFDMIVGVRAGPTSKVNLSGLYYQAGMDADLSQQSSSGSIGLDTFYGSFSALSSGGIVGHQRLQFGNFVQDFTYYDEYQTDSNGTYTDTATSTRYVIGEQGVRIGLGIGPYLSMSVALPAPAFTGSGVFLSPVGVGNSASSAPFTAALARGELITLVGTGLGPTTLQIASTLPLPTTLGGVQVLVNGRPAPLYYVSATQISAIVPWETTSNIAQIQVVYNGVTSNAVTGFVAKTAPGVFTIPPGGISYGAATHADGTLVSTAKPAQAGETISVYVTGLGDVFPGIADGAAGPSSTLSTTTNTIAAYIGGVSAPLSYQGLAPGFVALYQLNLQIPTGLTNGDNTLEIVGPDSDAAESIITIGPASSAAVESQQPAPAPAAASPRRRPHIAR
jgi:uncharacterized protein (TIGR03437 family)